jgi:hypothetical protein
MDGSGYNLPSSPYVPPSNVPALPPAYQPRNFDAPPGYTPQPAQTYDPQADIQRLGLGKPPEQMNFDPALDGSGNYNVRDESHPDSIYAKHLANGGQPPDTINDWYAKAKAMKGSDLDDKEQDALAGNYRNQLEKFYLDRGAKPAFIKGTLSLFDKGLPAWKKSVTPAEATATKNTDSPLTTFGYEAENKTVYGIPSDLAQIASGGAELAEKTVNAPARYGTELYNYFTGGNRVAPQTHAISDILGNIANPALGGAGASAQDYATQQTKAVMGANYNDPQYAKLRADLTAQNMAKATGTQAPAIAGGAGLPAGYAPTNTPLPERSLGNIEELTRERNAATNPISSAGGDLAGTLAEIFLTRKIPALKGMNPSTYWKIVAPLLAAQTGTETAREQVGTPQGVSMGQLAADYPVDTAMNLAGTHLPVKSGTIRALSGAGIGAVESAVRGLIDKAVNPDQNTGSPYAGMGPQATLMAIMAALSKAPIGGAKPLKGGKTDTTQTTNTVTPPPAGGAGGTVEPQAAQPAAGLPTSITEAPGAGIAGKAYTDLEDTSIDKTAKREAAIKKTLGAAKATPQGVIHAAATLAQKYAGETWADMSAEQRANLTATVAQKIHGAGEASPPIYAVEGTQEAINAIRDAAKPAPAPAPTAPAGGETAMPADVAAAVGGTQVPGTVEPAPASAGEAPAAPAPVDPGTAEALRALPHVDPNAKDSNGPVAKKYAPQIAALGHDPSQISKAQAGYILGHSLTAEQLQGVLHTPGEAPGQAAPAHVADEIHSVLNDANNEPTTVKGQGDKLAKTVAKIKAAQNKQAARTTQQAVNPLTARPEPIVLPPGPDAERTNVGGSTARKGTKAQLARQEAINKAADAADAAEKFKPIAQQYFQNFTENLNRGNLPYFQELRTRWRKGEFNSPDQREQQLQDAFKQEQEIASKPLVKTKPSNVLTTKQAHGGLLTKKGVTASEAPKPADTSPKMSDLLAKKGKGLTKSDSETIAKAKMIAGVLKGYGHTDEAIGKMSVQEAADAMDKEFQGTKGKPAEKPTPPKTEASAPKAEAQQEKVSLKNKLALITKDENLTPKQAGDLIRAVETAQQGNHEALNDVLAEHAFDKSLTKAIKKLAQEDYVSPREQSKAQIRALDEEAARGKEGLDADENLAPREASEVSDVTQPMELRFAKEEELGEELSNEPTPQHIQSKIDDINERARAGILTYEDARTQIRELREEAQAENQRGSEGVQSRLYRMERNSDEGSKPAIRMAQWLLKNNPNLAKGLGIGLKHMSEAGRYIPDRALAFIAKSGVGVRTIIHEILHHTEKMLPPDIQERIRAEYTARLLNKQKQAETTNNEALKGYLDAVRTNLIHPTEENRKAALEFITNKSVDPKEYKYLDPSEYWAETGSGILRRNHEAGSWIGKARNWIQEYTEHAKAVLGLDSDSAVYKGLKSLTASEGEALSTRQLNKSEASQASLENKDPSEYTDKDVEELNKEQKSEPILNRSAVGNVQKVVEYLANKREGIAQTMYALTRGGVKVTDSNNIFSRFYNYEGLKLEHNYIDDAEVYNPLNNFVHGEYAKTHGTPQEYMNDVNDWFRARMWLDHAHYLWTRDVPLKEGQEVVRQGLLEDLLDNKTSPEAKRIAQNRIAEKYAATPEREYMIKNGVPVDKLEATLSTLAKKGMDEKSLKPLNDMMQPVRDRTTQRRIASGELSQEDIRLRDSVGDKWYVPLKGPPDGVRDNQNQDIISQGINTRRYSEQIQIAEGRKSEAEKPFYRLIMDMHRAGERQAMHPVTETIYNAMLDANDRIDELQPKLDKLRAARNAGTMTQAEYAEKAKPLKQQLLDLRNASGKISVYKGNLARGFTDEAGTETPTLPVGRYDVVYNDGDTHYVMGLHADSQLLRGLVLQSQTVVPVAPVRAIGAATNAFARIATSVNIPWDTLVQFPRQWTFTPLLLATAKFDNPLQGAAFIAKNTVNNIKMLGAIRSIPARMMGDLAALKEYAAQNPNSPAAWVADYEAHGGRIGHTLGFNQSNAERLFLNKFSDIDYTKLSAIKQFPEAVWQRIVKYSGAYLSALDTFTRAGSYKTLVDSGVEPTQAAADVRATLDYSTAGRWSGTMNSLFAFSRTGLTSLDAARRAFVSPEGKFDYVKFGKWQGFLGAVGAGIAYPLMNALLGKDEDGKDRMAKIAPDTLTQQFVMPIGDKVIKIPIGQGLPQMMLAPGILAGAVMHGHMTFKEAVDAYKETLRRNTPRPLQPGRVAGHSPMQIIAASALGLTPTLASPPAEMNANVNAFGLPIHTEHYDPKLPMSEQGMKNTPQEFKDIARWMHNTAHYDVFPEDVRYIAQAYGGSMVNSIIRAAVSDRPFLDQGEQPIDTGLLSKAISNDEQFYLSRKLHSTIEDLQDNGQRYNTLIARAEADGASKEEAKAKADQVKNSDPEFKQGLDAYDKLNSAQMKYYKDLSAMRKDKMLSDERKAILRKQYDSTLRKVLEATQ